MANLKDVIYLSAEDYNTLYTNGTVTINGVTLTYDANNIYIVPDNTQQQIDDILALIPSSATTSNKLATASDIPTIPTNVSAFNNDAGYLTSHQDISGKANKASITAGTAGTSSATSGSTLSVPYVTMNGQGIVTGYGTHTHTVSGFLSSQDHYKSTVTAGTAGTSSATSGSSLSVPYITVNANGHVTGYGTHTHTVTGFLTSHQSVTTSNSTLTCIVGGSTQTVSIPLRYVGSSRVPGTYFVNKDSYGTSITSLPNAVAGDALFFKKYSNTIEAHFYDGSSWNKLIFS